MGIVAKGLGARDIAAIDAPISGGIVGAHNGLTASAKVSIVQNRNQL